MKRAAIVLAMMFALGAGCGRRDQSPAPAPDPTPDFGKAVNGLSCRVEVDRRAYTTNEAIILKCTVRNQTDKDIHFISSPHPYHTPEENWGNAVPEVVDGRGTPVAFGVGRIYVRAPDLSVAPATIAAGGTWQTELRIRPGSVVHNLPRWPYPGKYRAGVRFTACSLDNWTSLGESLVAHSKDPSTGFGTRVFGLEELAKMKVEFWAGELASSRIDIEILPDAAATRPARLPPEFYGQWQCLNPNDEDGLDRGSDGAKAERKLVLYPTNVMEWYVDGNRPVSKPFAIQRDVPLPAGGTGWILETEQRYAGVEYWVVELEANGGGGRAYRPYGGYACDLKKLGPVP